LVCATVETFNAVANFFQRGDQTGTRPLPPGRAAQPSMSLILLGFETRKGPRQAGMTERPR